jgi:M3 family oligoendopeptidase
MRENLPDFTTLDVRLPDDRALDDRYRAFAAAFEGARGDAAATEAAFAHWDDWRAEWRTLSSIVGLQFSLDTRSEARRKLQADLDALAPGVTRRDDIVKRRLLDPAVRPLLESRIGARPFDLWANDLRTFSPAVEPDLVREAELGRRYSQLTGSAEVSFEGRRLTLGELQPFLQAAARETRHAAEHARWSIFEGAREELDAVFDELVHVRDRIARTLGFENYLELGYRRMRRLDYGPSDVRAWRDEIARAIVPLAAAFVARSAAARGFERAYFWDESVLAASGGVVPLGDPEWIVATTPEAFAAIDPRLGAFAELMVERRLYDVAARAGKRAGAFCTSFPAYGVPFVFANAGGARSDVKTIVHEFGHAFASYASGTERIVDTRSPTSEVAEIHSMSLEYLAWPQMERFFGPSAAGYRREHLAGALLFLPYAAAVDHFQELAYANPGATPSERHAIWRELERRYLPWRDYGDLGHPAAGGLWQEKRHIYLYPLYYIDYSLALCCALQFWERAQTDRAGAIADYVALCGRGNDSAFSSAIAAVGLQSPFAPGTLDRVASAAQAALEVTG